MKREEWKLLSLDARAEWVRKRIECTPNDAWRFVDQIDKMVVLPEIRELALT